MSLEERTDIQVNKEESSNITILYKGQLSTHDINANSENPDGKRTYKSEYDKINSGKRYKASFYNYFIKCNDGYYHGFNFLYRSVIRMDEETFRKIDRLLRSSSLTSQARISNLTAELLSTQWLEALKETHFIIDTDFDELNFIKFRYYRSLYSSDSLYLVILPTLWCNLDCPYCFEYKKPVFMSKELEDVLLKWIETNFRNKRFIHISWFGGEPLIAKDAIYRLTEKIQKFCQEIGATYSSSLTTNGFFLDKEFQSKIPSLKIKDIQITLDGDEKDHNELRKQRDGKGSFDRIFENILSFCDNVKDCQLTLRVNCCDANYEGMRRFMECFPYNVRSQTNIFFRWIWASKASGYQDFASIQRGIEPFKGLSKLYKESSSLGWKTNNPHKNLATKFCDIDYLDQYCIDPEGIIYLCTYTFDGSDSIGSIFGGKNFIRPESISKYVSWYSANPFEDDECIICKLLPVCIGGCRKARFEGHRACIDEKSSIDLFVHNMIDELQYSMSTSIPK